MVRTLIAFTPVAVLVLVAGSAVAQVSVRSLVKRNDAILGVGLVTTIDAVAVNNAGSWIVESDTDHPFTDADRILIKDGAVLLRENDAIAPSPALISSFDSVGMNNNGDSGWNLFLRNTGASTNDSGVYFNSTLLIQESNISTAPQFSAGTPYIGFFEVKMTDTNRLFMVASIDDPAIATTVDRGLVWVNYDAGAGTFTESVLAKEGDVLPGVADAVVDFGTGGENFAITNAGSAMYVASLTGVTTTNGALYRDLTLVARKGDVSPIDGRIYTDIGTSTKLDMNNSGGYVFKAALSGDTNTNSVLIRNGARLIQKGDPVPGIPTETISSFGTGPVRITDAGDVVWYAQWTGSTATNQGLFLNNQLLVQKGVTQIDGETLTTVAGTTATGGITEGFAIGRDGRSIIFRGVLATTGVGAFMIELGCLADWNNDGTVDFNDFLEYLNDFNAQNPRADINGDGVVDFNDLLEFLNLFNAGC
ncbi:MAG: hypothetical protein FJ255_05800 [Phycisphaerae bacterium]|nr:hypothetical protein [Phycisphaerae bacterium]